MKKTIYSMLAASVLVLGSCDSLLDTTNYEKYDSSNFPTSQKDAEQMVTGIYNRLGKIYREPEECSVFMSNLASDEMFGGGSTSNTGAQAVDRLMTKGTNFMADAWKVYYEGVFRANYALGEIPNLPDEVFTSKEAKDYLLGQAHFLRAWFNWQLADAFETFPLLESYDPVNAPRASVDEVFTSLGNDLKDAIALMPAKYGYSTTSGQAGRATKYAAEALLARIWMFYTGFYGKSDMAGISKQDIIGYLEDCKNNSGFGLVEDQRNIWPYTNEYSSGFAYNTDFNTYASKNNLRWVGNHSKETIWACHFSYVLSYEDTHCNRLGEFFGLRNSASAPDAKSYPYGIGYTNGTVNSKMVEEWVNDPDYGKADKRLWGSVLAVDNAAEIFPWLTDDDVELAAHKGNDSKEVEKTMFHCKKYCVPVCYSGADKGQLYKNFFYAIPGFNGENSNQYDNRNDVIFIRFADVLLMLDELKQTADGMNELRTRAGLAPYSGYTFERLQKERRYELCFEGTRFNDLRRWYPQTAGQVISDNQCGAFMEYRGKTQNGGYAEIAGNGMQKRYQETRGFWRVPEDEIILSEGVLTQTPGWDGSDANVWLFSNGNLPY